MSRRALTDFTPAVLFLSTAAQAHGLLADGEPIRIQVQREAGHRLATENKLGIVKEFVEIGTGATSLRRRPALRRMLTYLQQHPEIRVAIFPDPHRFSRNYVASQSMHQRLRKLGVDVISTGGEQSTPRDPKSLAALMAGGPAV
ncbi:recombinase family protein [Nocardia sp. NPDC051929]|uniref:recombinase family protein n=1 Tax=Nocardia sp. NPDC051929 TaxID=3364327 RepID=UPI0037CC1F99